MKLGSLRSAFLAGWALGPFAVPAEGRPAAGGTTARWARIAPATIALEGCLFDSSGRACYEFDATLQGGAVGDVIGTVRAWRPGLRAIPFEPSFLLLGAYAHAPDGRTRVSAFLALDLSPWGLPTYVVVGDFQGVLDTHTGRHLTEPVLAGVPPWGWCPGPLPSGPQVAVDGFALPGAGTTRVRGAPHVVDVGEVRPKWLFPSGHFHGRWRMP